MRFAKHAIGFGEAVLRVSQLLTLELAVFGDGGGSREITKFSQGGLKDEVEPLDEGLHSALTGMEELAPIGPYEREGGDGILCDKLSEG